jgi:hypothetical protein
MASGDAGAVVSAIRSHTPSEFAASIAPFEDRSLAYVCVIGSDGRAFAFNSAGTTDSWQSTFNPALSDRSVQDAIAVLRDSGGYRGSFVCSLEKSIRWPEDVRTQVLEFLERVPVRIPVEQQTRSREAVGP